MKNHKKSHKALIVVLTILFVLIVGVLILYFSQKENIDAVINAYKYSQDDIQQQIIDSKSDVQDTLEKYDISNLRDFTFEEEEQIRKGQITYEEALNKIMKESGVADKLTVASGGNSVNQELKNSSANNINGVPDIRANNNDAQSIVSEYAVKLYGLKAYYLGQIGNLADAAKAEYKSTKSLTGVAQNYLGQAATLEEQADSAVDSLLTELENKLKDVNADTSVVNTMKDAYVNEKNLKKSYYLSLYQNKK